MSIYPPPIRSAFSSATKTRVRVVAAVASVVGLVALLAVVTGFPMKQFKSPSVGPSFTATPTATRTPLVTVETHLTAISMVSPTEGWAVGYDGAGKRTRLLHFHSGSWTLAADPSVTILPRAVTMLSATDGWIGGAASDDGDNAAGVMLHYSDDEWTPFPLPPGAGAINSISMVSANEGWAVDDTPDSGHAHILHYTGGVWTIAKTMADHSLLQSVSMVNATDGWIAGRGSYNPGLNGTPARSGTTSMARGSVSLPATRTTPTWSTSRCFPPARAGASGVTRCRKPLQARTTFLRPARSGTIAAAAGT